MMLPCVGGNISSESGITGGESFEPGHEQLDNNFGLRFKLCS